MEGGNETVEADEKEYQPIDCAVHDELLARATVGRVTEITYLDERGEERTVWERIVDVFARGGAEYLTVESGLEIRLDKLTAVDGRSVSR